MSRALFTAALLLAAATVEAQPLTLTPRADANAALPPSIRVFDVTRAGTPLRASLLRADLSATDWDLEAVLSDQGTETVPSFAADAGVFAAVNGGYFGGGQSYSLVLEGGQTITPNIGALNRSGTVYYPTRSALGVSASRTPDVAWVYTIGGTTYAYPQPSPNAVGAPQPQPSPTFPSGGSPWDVATAIGGGPVLVQNGRAKLTWTEEVFFGGSGVDTTDARARTAVGYTAAGRLLIVAVPEAQGVTLPALAALLVELGAVEALNLDGGGSTALSAGGVTLVSTSRPVASALRLRTPRTGSGPTGRVYDTGDAGYRESGAWFESANAPYWGATRSRLNAVGTGADRAVFSFPSIEAGRYAIEAWWTPASNRATNAPFTVYHSGTGRTVRLDQTAAASGGRWNAVMVADLSPGDSLVVTDDATGPASPAYVSVDAIRLVDVTGTAAASPLPGAALRVGPNPASSWLDAAVTVRAPGRVQVELVDTLGRVVRQQAAAGAGEVRLRLDVRGLASGVYVLTASTPDGTTRRTVTVVR